jgi:uncharacterized protein YndB with AHSA1/START domain
VDCEILEFDAPHLLVYSWKGGPMKNSTIVRWELETVAEGTKLTLTHDGFKGVGGFIVRIILGNGWQNLLKKAIPKFLNL